MTIEALIFDVDGTLADTEACHLRAFNDAFDNQRLGWHWTEPDYLDLLQVTGGKERLHRYIDRLDLPDAERHRLGALVPAIHADKTRRYAEFVTGGAVPLRPGVARLLSEALDAGCKLAIASTTTAANIDALLQSTLGERGLHFFNVIACGDQVRAKKPAPDIYRLALAELGLEAHRAIAFEDSAHGMESARGAGLWTVVTPTFWSGSVDAARAGLVLPHLGDPAEPIPGEPGQRLRRAAWLTFDELAEIAAQASRPGAATAPPLR